MGVRFSHPLLMMYLSHVDYGSNSNSDYLIAIQLEDNFLDYLREIK
jgi:hypothetical protein